MFEMITKTYLASDSGPVELQEYTISADMLDVVTDISTTLE